ncbi:3-hydroxyacyl-CoA dehydrogenase NAD-binding domain-containing protein [Rhodovulum sp.]|uniref:3-hydroxyacyl-CoA dehydrogenase NAD-binding domain-containing protein n=1 Tax=Rhodovulum sp. TaxID=34009 RepID=UPI001842AF83|nr:3-hydroxyacyl-CoA dehydrogenase NAD-binding domain-containing protein [Rhodovulum sp.]HDR28977.1 carnitine 3-dehydrogenase [Rhodovulum sp.]
MNHVAAILGAGVIGAGWAARFALMGWQVRIFDPDPAAAARVGAALENARRALPGLHDSPLPPEGAVILADRISRAVQGADWIQESVPERLELKRTLYQKVQENCARNVILASSSAGFTPSALQGPGARRCPVLVARPADPVYLLPLVELVAAPDAPPATLARARDLLAGIGMAPLLLRAGTEGQIADRLTGALWREALWLVQEGIATTAEIDRAIRLGPGLSWAQAGPFGARLLAGGEEGLAPALARLGTETRLADLPEASETLARTLAEQSDAATGGVPVAELLRARDTDLVALLRALRGTSAEAGAHLAAFDAARQPPPGDEARPLLTQDRAVPLDWTDYNGHMTEARYLHAFGDATDRFMEIIGCDADYIAAGASFFTAETHIRHLAELHAGARFRVETTLLEAGGAKMHLFHRMLAGETLAATGEHLLLHVSLATRRSTPPGPGIARRLARIAEAHAALPRPDGAGRAVGQKPG